MEKYKHTEVYPIDWQNLENYLEKPVYYFSNSPFDNYEKRWIIINKLVISSHKKSVIDILGNEWEYRENSKDAGFYHVEVY